MPYVQCLAYPVLKGVFQHDALLDGYRLRHHAAQLRKVGIEDVEGDQFGPHRLVVDKPVLEHLGITRAEIVAVHGFQELSVEDDAVGIVEHPDLVFQSAEVYARLSTYRGVNH